MVKSSDKKWKEFVFAFSCFVSFFSIATILKITGVISEEAKANGVNVFRGNKLRTARIVMIVFAVIFPILPLNVVALAMLQSAVIKLYAAKDEKEGVLKEETVQSEIPVEGVIF